MIRSQNEKLQKFFTDSLASAKSLYLYQLKQARESVQRFEPFVALLPEGADWFLGSEKIYVQIRGSKSDFSNAVRKYATLLSEQPDIRVEASEFMADFKEHFVHVYLRNPNDCKLIEVEEIRKVLKPHPECVAAMKKLEQVG